jgi:CYTH domain-containing protein
VGKKKFQLTKLKTYYFYVKRYNRQTRYEVQVGNHTYEVDEFYGENQGLIIAEIELQSEEEAFENQTGWDRK